MSKIKINLVTVGHLPADFDKSKIKAWKSDVFSIEGDIDNYSLNNDSDGEDWSYTDANLAQQLPREVAGDFLIALVNVPLELNWYSRRLNENKVIFTFHEMREILQFSNIPLENIVFRLLYAYSLQFKRSNGKLPTSNEYTNFTHDETRGCLFDMNGLKTDVVHSCHQPIICPDCIGRLRNETVSDNLITKVQQEIKKVQKPLFYRVLDFVKVHPLRSLTISAASAIVLGAIGSYLATIIYVALNGQV
ncbi:MAG: hypothetical protein ACI9FB_004264 [Candidatus Azotimanducaceae bacterium]|jgi:hypothetical protein